MFLLLFLLGGTGIDVLKKTQGSDVEIRQDCSSCKCAAIDEIGFLM